MTEAPKVTPSRRDKLSLKTHISYGVSQFGLNCVNTALMINVIFLYTVVVKFDNVLLGIILLVAQVWGAVCDPIMGLISDNTTWRAGRRRPYFLIGSIPYGITFFLIFSPPELSSTVVIFFYLMIMTLIMFTSRSVFETPYLALAPELTLDYDERTKLSGYKQLFGTLGDAQGAILPFLLLALFHQERRPAHLVYGIIGCAAMIGLAVVTHWGTFENPHLRRSAKISVSDSFKALAKNQPYLIFLFSSTLVQVSNNIVTFLVVFIATYWFGDEQLAMRFFLVFFVGCVCAVPLWVRLANAIGKKWAYITDLTGYGMLLCAILFLARDARLAATVVMFLAGMFNVGLWVLSGTIQPDIIEWDEYHTGKRREGVYSSIWTVMNKVGVGIAALFTNLAIRAIHLDPELPAQTEATLAKLILVFGPIPGALLFIGALGFLLYPISKRKHEEIRRAIETRAQALPEN